MTPNIPIRLWRRKYCRCSMNLLWYYCPWSTYVLWYMKNQQKAMIEQSSQYTHKMICVYISEMAFVITHTINMCAVLNYVIMYILCLYFKKCSTLVLSNNNREYLFGSTAAEKWQNKGWIHSNNENKTDYRRSSKSHHGNIGGWLRKKAVVK